MRGYAAGRWGSRVAALVGGLALAVLAVTMAVSCEVAPGAGTAAASSSSSVSATSTSASTPTPNSGATATPQASALEAVFSELAMAVLPTTVFVPGILPEGAVLAHHWLPVLESADPLVHDGPARPNPYITGSGADAEIQVVFTVGRGWLLVIENFHGDLGDVTAIPIGEVEGNPAALFEVNGGDLVQWSCDGRWYGVFGRAVSRDVILATALGMRLQPGASELISEGLCY